MVPQAKLGVTQFRKGYSAARFVADMQKKNLH
jgi:hypothetical protein